MDQRPATENLENEYATGPKSSEVFEIPANPGEHDSTIRSVEVGQALGAVDRVYSSTSPESLLSEEQIICQKIDEAGNLVRAARLFVLDSRFFVPVVSKDEVDLAA